MDKDFGKSYTRFIEGVELKRIELEKMELQRYRPKQINNIEVNVDHKGSLDFQADSIFVVHYSFEIEAYEKENRENKLFRLAFMFSLLYHLESQVNLYSEDVVNVFIEKNVPVNVWPYAREMISSMTVRMGLPALVIGTYKVFPKIEGEEKVGD